MSSPKENLKSDSKVIIIEPVFRTEPFIRFLIKSIKSTLKLHGYEYHSIQNQGYFIIITIKNSLKLVDSFNGLKFISGISYILIGTAIKSDFETLAKKSALIQLKLLFDNEKYFLKVTSIHNSSSKSRELIYSLFDLEFHIQSELSSSARGLVRVDVESDADRVLYIITGPKLAYISLLVHKGPNDIPFNYLKDSVLCPVFDTVSIISFIAILRSGYRPIPIFYYWSRNHLKNLIKAYEFYARRNTEGFYEFYLFSMGDLLPNVFQELFSSSQNSNKKGLPDNSLLWINYQILVFNILSKCDLLYDKVALPLVTFVHPLWYMNKVYSQFKNSNKTPITPLLFNYTIDDFRFTLTELKHLDVGIETNEHVISNMIRRDTKQHLNPQMFNSKKTLRDLKTRHKKFKLKVSKDDIFDIFNSI